MNYLKIDKEDVCNGEGLRVVLWLSGCSHKCKGCQNPQTWDANSGIPFDDSAKEELFRELDKDYISGLTLTGGDPLFENNLDVVLDLITEVNERYNTAQNIVRNQDENHNILNENANEIRLSCPQKSIWLYSGFTWEECQPFTEGGLLEPSNFAPNLQKILKKRYEIISKCDVFVDGKYIDSQRDISYPFAGSRNQRVINVVKSIQNKEVTLY